MTKPESREAHEYLTFLVERVARKEWRVDVDPTFEGEKIQSSYVMIGKPAVQLHQYLGWINNCVRRKIKHVYILATGNRNIKKAHRLFELLNKDSRFVLLFEEDLERGMYYDDEKTQAICRAYEVRCHQDLHP